MKQSEILSHSSTALLYISVDILSSVLEKTGIKYSLLHFFAFVKSLLITTYLLLVNLASINDVRDDHITSSLHSSHSR